MTPSEVAHAVARYSDAQPSPSGECATKTEVVAELGKALPDTSARAFLLGLLRSANDYDLARVEVCRVLETLPPSQLGDSEEWIDVLLQVVNEGEDVLVGQWAARALRTFSFSRRVVEAAVRVARNRDIDLDVRHNALASVESELDPEVARTARVGLLATGHN